MNTSATTLQQFGASAGITDLRLDARGQAVLRTDSGQLLGLEQTDQDMLVYVAQPARYDASDRLLQACKRAHHSRLGEWSIQPALRNYDDTPHLLVLIRLASHELTEARLHQAFAYLSQWLETLDRDI